MAPALGFAFVLAIASVGWLLAHDVGLSPDRVLVAFVAYQMRLVVPIQGLMGLYTSIASARASSKTSRGIMQLSFTTMASRVVPSSSTSAFA
mgnify:CR=1 FL=1